MADDSTILVCTVGGSHQPILTALKARRWERVVFVCSAQTPESQSSAGMVTQGVEIAAQELRTGQSLPPIPAQAGLPDGSWEVLEVPPDDPDRAFSAIVDRLRALAGASRRIVADYTGGTKSMSAALVLAAFEAGAELQLVSGRRGNLVRVLDRTEREIAIGTRRVATAREFERLAAGWRRYAYREAAEGFARLWDDLKQEGWSREERRSVTRAKELSEAFAAWDCFDHKRAANDLAKAIYKSLAICGRSDWSDLAAELARSQDAPWGALHLRDLWNNAERRAARGRYDDAVARLYRLWEGMAQWLLRVDCRIDTAIIQIGLRKSWELYLHLRPDGAAASFWHRPVQLGQRTGTEIELLDLRLSARNKSILAHGWNAVTASGWQSLAQWTENGLLGVLAKEAERLGEEHRLPQLPTALPAL